MDLEATSTIGTNFLGQKRTITLHGGNPCSFYRTILQETPDPEFAIHDPEWATMCRAERDWKPSRLQLLRYGDKCEEGKYKNSQDLLGVKLSLLKEIGRQAELKCLRMFLCLMEATNDNVSSAIVKTLKEGN